MNQTMIQALEAYFSECPLLQGKALNIDYLPPNAAGAGAEYSIATAEEQPVLQRFFDGSSMRQLVFYLCSINPSATEAATGLENVGFYEQMADWIERQNKAGELPMLPAGKTARSLELLKTAQKIDDELGVAKYQMQLKLEYYQKGER